MLANMYVTERNVLSAFIDIIDDRMIRKQPLIFYFTRTLRHFAYLTALAVPPSM